MKLKPLGDRVVIKVKEEEAKEEGVQKTILFNLSGHGLIDMTAYDQFMSGKMKNYALTDEEIARTTDTLEKLV